MLDMDDLPEKMSSYVIFDALVQKLIFQDGANGHFGYEWRKMPAFFRGTGGLNLF